MRTRTWQILSMRIKQYQMLPAHKTWHVRQVIYSIETDAKPGVHECSGAGVSASRMHTAQAQLSKGAHVCVCVGGVRMTCYNYTTSCLPANGGRLSHLPILANACNSCNIARAERGVVVRQQSRALPSCGQQAGER